MGFLKLNDFSQKLYAYVEARLELAKLETEERIGRASALVIQLVLMVILLGSTLLFLNIALALYLNTFSFCKGAPYMGFALVAGVHFSLILMMLFMQGKLLRGIKNLFYAFFARFMKYVEKAKF